jgi:hypothetical protein
VICGEIFGFFQLEYSNEFVGIEAMHSFLEYAMMRIPGPCEAMDGRARAHMDVLVACPGMRKNYTRGGAVTQIKSRRTRILSLQASMGYHSTRFQIHSHGTFFI